MRYLLIILLTFGLKLFSQTTFSVVSTSVPCIDNTIIHIGDTLKTTAVYKVSRTTIM